MATRQIDGITHYANSVVLCVHSDASYLKKTKSWTRVKAVIFCSDDTTIPHFNGPILTLAKNYQMCWKLKWTNSDKKVI